MADSTIDKIKDQYIESILNAVPMSQIGFVFVTAVILQRLADSKAGSTLDALANIGIKSLFGFDDGIFWNVDLLKIASCLVLALFNAFVVAFIARTSFKASKIDGVLNSWIAFAMNSANKLDKDERAAAQKSIAEELEARRKRYRAKRLVCEVLFAVPALICYTSFYLCIQMHRSGVKVTISWPEVIVCIVSGVLFFFHNRASVAYAVEKIVPFQVYQSALTGQLIFIEGAN
ncbi:hypothetical protein [Caballeronia sp. INSB1]|uniref:hypothetical protein n=1 Tax=Caballeronia sp. INSB1 TaxID=2921751 RepID=UPI0020329BBB|nr:hypothetical protein [Caballeronia sp. INSB1]